MIPNVYQTLEEGDAEINDTAALNAATKETAITSINFFAGLSFFFGGTE